MNLGFALGMIAALIVATLSVGVLLRGRTGRARAVTARGTSADDAFGVAAPERFGARATLVQFSTATCARCPGTARQLGRLSSAREGVTHVDVDLGARPDLVSRFGVRQTPTVLIVDSNMAVRTRIGGPPRPQELASSLDAVLSNGDSHV